jgi:hypothetical protein
MRTVFLLPLTAGAMIAAGCGPRGREQAAPSVPRRDLTLQAQGGGVEVASAVELQNIQSHRHTPRASRRISRLASTPLSSPIQATPAPAAVAAAPALALPVARPVSTVSDPVSDRELPPGKTVTVIPASSGPSTEPGWTDEAPRARGGTMVVGGGGGRCRGGGRGRGPGIGIAAAPRPDFR